MVEGTQVGAYRVLNRIGEGGMGTVWMAEHVTLGRRAALKVLHPEFSLRQEIVTRFFNEARAATAIADPGIVQIFDFGQHVDGSAYLVMELLDGEPLDRRLARQGVFAIRDALRIMRQVASTLGAAHARGIVHRDIKPENIFIVRDPEVPGGERAKVLDFGIAKLGGDQAGVKTQTSAVMGTPTYMSPEQCRGAGHVDARADVYALGCVLFTLIVGRPPFDAEGVGDIIAMHLREPAPTPSLLRGGIPPEVDHLILRCLAKDPAHRFQSAGELAAAIGALVHSSPQLPPGMASSSAAYAVASAPTTLSSASGVNQMAPPRRSRVGLVVAIVGLGVVGGGIALGVRAADDGDSPKPSTEPVPAVTSAPTPAPTPATPPAPPPSPRARAKPRIKDVLAGFVAWSHDHAGAPCPDAATLGVADDPWGHPFRITCTDQPGDQIVGAISAGPDGTFETDDDIASWQLGPDVTDAVRGARWTVAAAPKQTPTTPAKDHTIAKPTHSNPRPAAPTVQLDENGLPISR
ncbi:MAG TPA: serine/threonine-protein kinase [Kofleriaceae bacterium]|jgi:serine/threonine-protein kinase